MVSPQNTKYTAHLRPDKFRVPVCTMPNNKMTQEQALNELAYWQLLDSENWLEKYLFHFVMIDKEKPILITKDPDEIPTNWRQKFPHAYIRQINGDEDDFIRKIYTQPRNPRKLQKNSILD
jgi:hypothetical protein